VDPAEAAKRQAIAEGLPLDAAALEDAPIDLDGAIDQLDAGLARNLAEANAAAASGGKLSGLFPGLFISTAPARPVRPVLQLDTGLVELISPLEQPYLDIACTPEDVTDILHVRYSHFVSSGYFLYKIPAGEAR
jgi:hypothetical protein